MDILNKLLPHLNKGAEEREAATRSAVEKSAGARRDAEADMIKAYRKMGYELERRHEWSER